MKVTASHVDTGRLVKNRAKHEEEPVLTEAK